MPSQTVDNQQEKVNYARSEGLIVSGILECIRANEGFASRKDIVPFVADAVGLSNDEREALHETETGSMKNYFLSVVDFTLTDMKNMKYGEDCQLEKEGEEPNTLWTHADIFSVNTSHVKEVAKYVGIRTQKDRRAARIARIIEVHKTSSAAQRDMFKLKNGKRDDILNIMEERNCSAEAAFSIFFET